MFKQQKKLQWSSRHSWKGSSQKRGISSRNGNLRCAVCLMPILTGSRHNIQHLVPNNTKSIKTSSCSWSRGSNHRLEDVHPCCPSCRTFTTRTWRLADIHPSRRLCSLYMLTTISHSYSPLPEIGHQQYGCQRTHYVSWKPSNIEHEHSQHRTADPWHMLRFCKTDTIAVIVRGRRNGERADSVLWQEVRKVYTASVTKTADQTMLSYNDWNRSGCAMCLEIATSQRTTSQTSVSFRHDRMLQVGN